MSIFDALLLGLIQGLTEFIPVSSSGHLIIFNEVFSLQSNFTFDILLNIGTVLAAAIYFHKEIKSLVRFKSNGNLTSSVAITTLPAVVVGLIVGSLFESASREVTFTIIMLIAVGLLFLFERRIGSATSGIKDMSLKQALIIGLAQAVAIIPGTSRSGATILAAKQQGLTRSEAARYSFLVSVPVISGAIIYSLVFKSAEIASIEPVLMAVGIAASFASSMLAIHFMIKTLQRLGLAPFGIYRVVLGVVLLFVL